MSQNTAQKKCSRCRQVAKNLYPGADSKMKICIVCYRKLYNLTPETASWETSVCGVPFRKAISN